MSLSHSYRAKLRDRMKAYFAQCEERGRMPTVAGLKVAMRVGEERWNEVREDRLMKPHLELAVARIQDELEQRGGQQMMVMLHEALENIAEEARRTFGVEWDTLGG